MTPSLVTTSLPIQAVHCVSCRFDLFPHHSRVCQGNKFLTAWATTWVSSSASSSLRLCFWLSNGRTATLPTTKVMSLPKCQGGRCHRVKGQGQNCTGMPDPGRGCPCSVTAPTCCCVLLIVDLNEELRPKLFLPALLVKVEGANKAAVA